ncbi:hypothetical protein V6N11_073720 [Hibiscus sabdariffa]|uniref:Uncharacterized protein n=1 Tax=Hibiscus sabdariffa TaxID=183260 RepID=A0ABR2AE52_9ROSI
MSSRGLKLAVPPEMQQNPSLELNNGDSSRGMPCGQQIILILCLFYTFVCSAPQNVVAIQLLCVFPLVKRQLAQKFTCRLGQIQMANTISLRSLLQKEKLNGINFLDWFRNLRIVLKQERKEYVIEEPVPKEPGANAPRADKDKFKKYMDDMVDVGCLMLATMTPKI